MQAQTGQTVMRFTPQMYIDYHVRRLGIQIEDIGIASTVIITWFSDVRESLARSVNGQLLPHAPFRNVVSGFIESVPVTVVQCPIGAPGTIACMEELIVCGAKRFIGVGAAGSLQPQNPIGSLIIADTCVSDEGTSKHYDAANGTIHADANLRNVLAQSANKLGYHASVGTQWTIDAIYRESIETIELRRKSGVLGVDMETSAMYALGQFRGVQVANILAISDELWHEWNPAFGTELLREALDHACAAALEAISTEG